MCEGNYVPGSCCVSAHFTLSHVAVSALKQEASKCIHKLGRKEQGSVLIKKLCEIANFIVRNEPQRQIEWQEKKTMK